MTDCLKLIAKGKKFLLGGDCREYRVSNSLFHCKSLRQVLVRKNWPTFLPSSVPRNRECESRISKSHRTFGTCVGGYRDEPNGQLKLKPIRIDFDQSLVLLPSAPARSPRGVPPRQSGRAAGHDSRHWPSTAGAASVAMIGVRYARSS
jgi:hypothetical protein